MNKELTTSSWMDKTLYPFESKFIQLSAGQMHYVDQGQGEILLFVHGTPTWSFLYRNFIKSLSKNNRCIAIDHLGFGLSENPVNFSGTPEDHAKNLSELINRLDLQDITLVVHDFGGPIGLAAGIENADRIKQVVLFNTWLWATKNNKAALKVDKFIKSWMGKTLYLNFNFSPKVLLKMGFSDKKLLSKKIHQHYIKVFPDKKSRLPLLHIGESLVGSSDWYQDQWEKLDLLVSKPWLILWGSEDQFIKTEYLDRWKKRIPQAKILEFQCGHFVQEEKGIEAIVAIRNFIHERAVMSTN